MENACKHANRPDDLRISIHIAENDGWIVGFSGDNGDGMGRKKLGAVFDEFYRGDESRSSGCDGNSGLGLYVCRYIIKGAPERSVPTRKTDSCGDVNLPEAAGSTRRKRPCRKRAGSERKGHAPKRAGLRRKAMPEEWQGVKEKKAMLEVGRA